MNRTGGDATIYHFSHGPEPELVTIVLSGKQGLRFRLCEDLAVVHHFFQHDCFKASSVSENDPMPAMTNPMDALKSFEPALKRGELKVERGRIDPDLIVHLDHPNGELRLTYAKMRGEAVASLALLTPAEPYEGTPVMQLGYAVPQHLRKRGLAKAIAKAAIDEFTAGMALNGVKSFYVEAVVSIKNVASQKVAAQVVGGEPKEILDEYSGEPALQYMRKIDC